MLIHELDIIGGRLLDFRKKRGLTQGELAELAGLADRTYADIERGSTNMRLETLLRICDALQITPNELLLQDSEPADSAPRAVCTSADAKAALRTLEAYLDFLCK